MVEERVMLTNLSTKALLEGVTALLGTERRTVARLIAHLIEVDDRRAHLEMACSSLFDFCVRKLGLSEGEAFRRINAARLVRRFPVILGMIEDGRIHLSALVLLRDHLTDDNHGVLLGDAAGKTKSELKELLAARSPRPDVVPSIRKLLTIGSFVAPSDGATHDAHPSSGGSAWRTSLVEPLAPARYKVQLTASSELKDKLERAVRLMSHRHPEMDLAVVVERALDLLIVALEKERFGKTARPRTPRGAKPAHVTRAVRREVVARDGEQCSFVSREGERCPARAFLEFDHRHPRALGGTGEAANARLLCRSHNRLEAERIFGKKDVAERIHLRRRKRSLAGAGLTANVCDERDEPASCSSTSASPGGDSRADGTGVDAGMDDTSASPSAVPSAVFALAVRALTTMGFRAGEAEKAVSDVRTRLGVEQRAIEHGAVPLVEDVLRASLAVLDRARTLQIPRSGLRSSETGPELVSAPDGARSFVGRDAKGIERAEP